MSLNPKIATLIYLVISLSSPLIFYLFKQELVIFFLISFFILIFDLFVEGAIFSTFESKRILHILETLNQLIICFLVTFIPWLLVLKVLDIFSLRNLDRTKFTLFIGVCFILTVLFYWLLKKIDIFTKVDSHLSQIFNLKISTSHQKRSQLDTPLLGQIADILTILITVLLLANSAYTAIESNFNSSPIKTKDLSTISEYLYLIPGIAVYSLATYYKIIDFLLKTKSKETM
ncbi:hypothetical protein [Rummeliibacillus sp. TYF-LIM-RU47]|uniref:hypothetical protein n=1 Tax=Rummeliibacillus sp. TYF-LIM-RU47 TaxID=2608406 RepID=UPI00123909E8|nr:hypothetical protein [Rummeliibacillus sp. TYF-LIM-RU47]